MAPKGSTVYRLQLDSGVACDAAEKAVRASPVRPLNPVHGAQRSAVYRLQLDSGVACDAAEKAVRASPVRPLNPVHSASNGLPFTGSSSKSN
jgi:hypothetical protein